MLTNEKSKTKELMK